MRALFFKRYGGPDQLALADIPRPVPTPEEILVQGHLRSLVFDHLLNRAEQ